jgi:glucan-binding YG repeat protein
VRSFEATRTDAVYNGMPQTFVVTINGETFTYETDYVVPGEYNVGTYEGAFEDNTIGVKDIIVNIDKAPCQYEVILPFEKIEYDGEAHGATVIVPEGSGDVTIIYENAISGERTTEAPVEPGLYDVYIIITEGEYYYGIDETNVGQFEITAPETSVEELSTSTMDNGAWYTIDGRRVAAPTNGVYIHNGKKYVIVK